MAKQAKVCFVLPLREAIAHFSSPDLGPMEAEVGSLVYGDAHASIDVSTKLRAGFLPLLGKKGRQFLQQSFSFFAKEYVRQDHKQRKMTALSKACL
jgi:hypothetical protein